MTQAELELVAKEMRARALHSSWDELLTLAKYVVGSLVDAYQALLRSSVLPDGTSSNNPDDGQKRVKDKLAKALTLLTSEAQVARWESEALAGNSIHGIQEVKDSGFKEN